MDKSQAISTLMHRNVKTLQASQSLWDVQELMRSHKIRHVPIVKGNEVLGIMSQTDMKRLVHIHQDQSEEDFLKSTPIKDVMMQQLFSLTTQATIADAAEILVEGQFSALPIFENGVLVGIVTTTDFVKLFVND